MTIDELVDSVAGQFERELDHVFKQQVRTNVIIARAEAIRQYMDKHGATPSSFLNQINVAPTTVVDVAEWCDLDLECDIVRTENKIPEPIRIKGKNNSFTYVGEADNSNAYGFILDPGDVEYILKDRWMSKCENFTPVFYSYVNDYIYVINDNPEQIRVRGVFADVDAVLQANNCNGDNCVDSILTIPDDVSTVIKDLVYREMRGTPIIPSKEEIQVGTQPAEPNA